MEHRCTQLDELDKDGEYQVETTRAGGWGLYATVSRRLTELDKIAEGISYCPFCGKEMLSRCKGVDFLVIDDLGNEEPRGIQAVKAILDARRCERPTIVTTQLTPDIRSEQFGDLYGVETAKAMQSRLALMKSVSFTGADRRSRQ